MDSQEEIMDATYSALCRHGYADLTIEKIAEESEKGKSLIYYHFDDKDDLMTSFLDHMKEKLSKQLSELEEVPGEDRLDELLELLLGVEDEEMWEFHKALFELQVQAYHSREFAEKFEGIDSLINNLIEDTLREKEVEEPEVTAELMTSAIEGILARKTMSDDRKGMQKMKEKLKEMTEKKTTL
jgi:AcrR family transcriptional regulator